MGMTPDNYLDTFVLGNLQDCRRSPRSLRCAFNAAVSAAHVTDHYYEYNRRWTPELVADFKVLDDLHHYLAQLIGPAYWDIRSLSNAYKHLYEFKKRKGFVWSVASTGSLQGVEFPKTDHLEYAHNYDAVAFRRRDGTEAEFLPTLERVVLYWYRLLHEVDTLPVNDDPID